MNTIQNLCNQLDLKSDINTSESLIYEICNSFMNKWSNYTNAQLIDDSNKENFLYDIKITFNTFYQYFGSKKILKEIEICLKEDLDGISDVEEYLEFVDNLKNIKDVQSEDINDENSEILKKIKSSVAYLQKKNQELEDLNQSFRELNDKLDTLDTLLSNKNL